MLLIEWTSTEGIAMGLAGWPSCRLRDRVLLSIRGWAVPVIPQGLLCWSCQALACRQGAGWTPPAVGWPSGVTTPPRRSRPSEPPVLSVMHLRAGGTPCRGCLLPPFTREARPLVAARGGGGGLG